MKHRLGLVIGKFYPPHRGHQFLIETATAQSERTVVIVCAKATDKIGGELRGQWLREMHPSAEVMVIDDHYDANDSAAWAENTVRWLGRAPAAVFTSEAYGERYAALMGAKHIAVDPARAQVPISATAVRDDPFSCWEFLERPVRGWFAKRVCVAGTESTGTTTLAKALAGRLETTWVEEYGREYCLYKQTRGESAWRTSEFVHIAEEQKRREDQAARLANRVLICDTNSFATALWHRRYLGGRSEAVETIAQAGRCDLYLLTGDEIAFVQDGLRDGEGIRHEMLRWFEEALSQQAVPWKVLRGSHEERLDCAVQAVRELFAGSGWKPGVK